MSKNSSEILSNHNKHLCFFCFQDKMWIKINYFFNIIRRVCFDYWEFLTNFLTWICDQYTHSLSIRNGVKSWWVRFLYFPDFWMVFVSYFPNFLWSPFLKFFLYFFEKHKFIFITKNLDIFTHYSIAIVWFECIFFWIISLLASFWIF